MICTFFHQLHQNLYANVVNNSHFPNDPILALQEGFKKTECDLLQWFNALCLTLLTLFNCSKMNGLVGSTACAALLLGNMLYVANVGDSGAILYKESKTKDTIGEIVKLTSPHDPNNPMEADRVKTVG